MRHIGDALISLSEMLSSRFLRWWGLRFSAQLGWNFVRALSAPGMVTRSESGEPVPVTQSLVTLPRVVCECVCHDGPWSPYLELFVSVCVIMVTY